MTSFTKLPKLRPDRRFLIIIDGEVIHEEEPKLRMKKGLKDGVGL